jgi:hypothetical protein
MKTLMRVVAAMCIALGLLVPHAEAQSGTFLSMMNEVRVSQGLNALETSGELTAVANDWAATMAAAYDIWHNPSLGSQVSLDWRLLGENVGKGVSADAIFSYLMDSPLHYANIVEPSFDLVGIGIAYSSDGLLFTAHVFADVGSLSPQPPPPPSERPEPTPEPAVEPSPPAAVPPEEVVVQPVPPTLVLERVEVVFDILRSLSEGIAEARCEDEEIRAGCPLPFGWA